MSLDPGVALFRRMLATISVCAVPPGVGPAPAPDASLSCRTAK